MNEQYGNSGYNRVEDNGYNNGQQGDRFNNFVRNPYDGEAQAERTSYSADATIMSLTHGR
jgi:hypothetical protein